MSPLFYLRPGREVDVDAAGDRRRRRPAALNTGPSLDEADTGLIVNHLYGADGMARIQGGKDLNVMYVKSMAFSRSRRAV